MNQNRFDKDREEKKEFEDNTSSTQQAHLATLINTNNHRQHTNKASANNISSDELLSIYVFCSFRSLLNASRTCKWWYHVSSKVKSRK